jgi:hypothetical protein
MPPDAATASREANGEGRTAKPPETPRAAESGGGAGKAGQQADEVAPRVEDLSPRERR